MSQQTKEYLTKVTKEILNSSKEVILGLPVSPSYLLDWKICTVTKVLLTFGGGMGGANKTYYCTKFERISERYGWHQITLLNGMIKEIQDNYIVETEEVRIWEIITDATDWKNYSKAKFQKFIMHDFYEIEPGYSVTLEPNKYISDSDLKGAKKLSNEGYYEYAK